MTIENLVEFVTSRGVPLKVDNNGGVIRGVKVLGTSSANGRSYPKTTLERALPLYAEARVNVNHPDGKPTQPRRYEERIGIIRDPVLREDGIYADLFYNPKHGLAAQLEWDAEHSPESVGLSHNVAASVSGPKGRMVVEDISKVLSVDLVADPATTRGLFESFNNESEENDMDLNEVTIDQLRTGAPELVKAIIAEAIAEHGDSTELEKIQAKCATLESDLGNLKTKVQTVTEERDALAVEKTAKEKHDAVEAVLADSKLPKDVLTEEVRTHAHSYDDIEGSKRYLATLEEAVQKVSGKPRSKEQGTTEGTVHEIKDGKSLIGAIFN